MRRTGLALALLLALGGLGPASGTPTVLPAISFEDQDGRRLDLASLLGRVVVIVYGGRSATDQHVAWGKRIDEELRARRVYRAEDDAARRPVQILALAQMGGIPEAFRPLLRGVLRQHVERGYSLWLDWDDRMSALFGARASESTVVVADRQSRVRLVIAGRPEGVPWQAVSELLKTLP